MLTFVKKIFTWWNRDTFGTRIKTILFGKLVGTDHLGNKYYESKNGKRWVIYAAEIDASKIPVEWYSWIHFTHNKIENNHELKKYDWQKPHQENLTGTDSAYYPNKNKNAADKKYKIISIVIILIMFWPIMSTGSLIKNWFGVTTFFIIGLCMCLSKFKNNY